MMFVTRCYIMLLFENLKQSYRLLWLIAFSAILVNGNLTTVYRNQEFITSSLPCARRRMSEIQLIRRSV